MRNRSRGVLAAMTAAAAVIAASVGAQAQTIGLPRQPSAAAASSDDSSALAALAGGVRRAWARAESHSKDPSNATDPSSGADPSNGDDPSTPADNAQAPATQAPAAAAPPPAAPEKAAPLAFADWTWLTGNPRTTESPITTRTSWVRCDSTRTTRIASTSR